MVMAFSGMAPVDQRPFLLIVSKNTNSFLKAQVLESLCNFSSFLSLTKSSFFSLLEMLPSILVSNKLFKEQNTVA